MTPAKPDQRRDDQSPALVPAPAIFLSPTPAPSHFHDPHRVCAKPGKRTPWKISIPSLKR
jgi:hypothetical protein